MPTETISARTLGYDTGPLPLEVTVANGYCVKCKAPREISDPKQITMKNGRPATEGRCPVCGTRIFKIGAPSAEAAPPAPPADPGEAAGR